MKTSHKFAVAALIALPLVLTGCESQTHNVPQIPEQKADAEYIVYTNTSKLYVIEFTSKANPDYGCVSTLLDARYDTAQTVCFPKVK